MNNTKVREKVSKIAAKSKKKLKKLVTNKRKGYSKLAIKHDVRGAFSSNNDYDDEDLEMEVDLNYDMNASYNYVNDPHNTMFNPMRDGDTHISTTTSQPCMPKTTDNTLLATSVTQTFIEDLNDRGLSRKTEYCVVPFYTLVSILSVITTALLSIHEISLNLGFLILLCFGFLGSAIGMYAIYAWGVFDNVLQYLSKQNEAYIENIDRLNSVGEVLQNDVDDIQNSVDYLKRDGTSLDQAMQEYNSLRAELQRIADEHYKTHGEHNQTLMEILDDLNESCAEMNTIIADNEKAHLLSIFYSVKLYDYGMKNCLDRKRYKQFLGYCNQNTRQKFIDYGGFEALDRDNTGFIDVNEFEQVVFHVLNITIAESQNLMHSSIKIQQRL